MNIIYVSSACSNSRYNSLYENKIIRGIPTANKYHQLLIEGLSKIVDGKIFAVTAIPTNHKWTKKRRFIKEEENIDNVTYFYEGFINYPVLRQFSLTHNAERTIANICKTERVDVIICDVLNYSICKSALKVAKKYGIKTVGIVTDIPGVQTTNKSRKFSIRKIIANTLNNRKLKQIEKFDSYLLLAEAMNEVVNKNKKPYVVIEGHADVNMSNTENLLENKINPKVVLYAGSLHTQYGAKLLTEAFIVSKFDNVQLHIYGEGNYSNELREIVKKHTNIKYFGIVTNDKVVQEHLKATLLVNPRPTNEDFVKYSFPSKTMEYMASGTPLLTTKIPSMPNEYYEYVYFIEDETVEGVKTALKDVLSKSQEELQYKGKQAKEFILKEKNNYKQAEKLLEFIVEQV